MGRNRIEDLVFSLRHRFQQVVKSGLPEQDHYEFEHVLAEAGALRIDKTNDYGSSRMVPHDEEFDLWMMFSDVHRKYIRLERQVKRRDLDGLEETYRDMLGYCAMNIVVLRRLRRLRDEV